jgi:hypothetical protein
MSSMHDVDVLVAEFGPCDSLQSVKRKPPGACKPRRTGAPASGRRQARG